MSVQFDLFDPGESGLQEVMVPEGAEPYLDEVLPHWNNVEVLYGFRRCLYQDLLLAKDLHQEIMVFDLQTAIQTLAARIQQLAH
jgi:hypothetical protein